VQIFSHIHLLVFSDFCPHAIRGDRATMEDRFFVCDWWKVVAVFETW
jgi:hypothetical protein